MPEKITSNTVSEGNLHADNLVKVVTVTEWNELLNTIKNLQHHISTVNGVAYGALDKADKALQNSKLANKKEEEK